MEDTISILRGLKDSYETHHGVKILDSSLVAAAVLSSRYITDRFLPDKAIDLVDEACHKVRMEIDSLPIELDELNRKIMLLEIERVSLSKEDYDVAKERLAKMDKEIASLKEEQTAYTLKWQKEKEELQAAKNAKSDLEKARHELEVCINNARYEEAAKQQYQTIPSLEI